MDQDWRETKNALSRFATLRKTGLFSDCKITLNYSEDNEGKNLTKVYHVHAVILQSASAVFEAMLSENFIEGQNRNIILHDMNPKHFECFLDFIYEDQCIFSDTEEACRVYEIAHKYLMRTCMDFCVEFIKKRNLDINDAPMLYNFSIFFNLKELRQTSWNTILLDFDKIEIGAVDKKLMADVLDAPVIYVPENVLFEKLSEWIELKRNEISCALISEYIQKIHFFEIPNISRIDLLKLLSEEQANAIMSSVERPLPAGINRFEKKRIILPRHRVCECDPVTEICSISSREMKALEFNSNSLVKVTPPSSFYSIEFIFTAKNDGWLLYFENGSDFVRFSIQNQRLSFVCRLGGEDLSHTYARNITSEAENKYGCRLAREKCGIRLHSYLVHDSYTLVPNEKTDCFTTRSLQLGGVGYSFEGCLKHIHFRRRIPFSSSISKSTINFHSDHIFASEVKPLY